MIQKFVEGLGDHSNMLKTDWSSQFTLFSSFMNLNLMTNSRLSLKQRYDTFEVGSTHIHETPVKPDITKNAIEDACKSVAAHLHNSCPGYIKVNSMTVFLKCDGDNQLWVLFWKSLNLVNFQKALSSKKTVGNQTKGFLSMLANSSSANPNKGLLQYNNEPTVDRIRMLQAKKTAAYANDLGVRIREREMVFEPEVFYRSIKLTNHKNQSFSWPRSLPYCRLCLTLKHCGCQLPFRYVKRSLVFDTDRKTLSMDRSEQTVHRFVETLKKADPAAGGHLTRLRELEQEDLRVVKNQEEIDNNVPQLLRWILGPKSFDELWEMFCNDTFLDFKIPCCMECYLAFTKE